MENQIDLKKEIHFVLDYRSNPNGIGTIFFNKKEKHRKILITDGDTGPKDMETACKEIKPEFWPNAVIHIPLDNQFWNIANQCLGAILVSNEVAYVSDSEMANECPDLVCDQSQNLFLIQNWLIARGIKGIL